MGRISPTGNVNEKNMRINFLHNVLPKEGHFVFIATNHLVGEEKEATDETSKFPFEKSVNRAGGGVCPRSWWAQTVGKAPGRLKLRDRRQGVFSAEPGTW